MMPAPGVSCRNSSKASSFTVGKGGGDWQTIEATIDIQEWALYFAAFATLGSTEGNITLDTGDDYYIYRRPSDGRWIILPWDLDACFDQATQVLFRPTIDQIERFLEHPRYAPLYWCYLETFMADAFQTDLMNSRIDHLTPLFNSSVTNVLRTCAASRHNYISSRISPSLTTTVPSGGRICGNILFADQPDVSLSGLAPGCGTTEVRIDGTAVSYNPQTNAWSGNVTVSGTAPLSITAVDRNGLLVARRNLTAQPAVNATVLPSSIASPMTLVPAQSPYRVEGATTVEPGASLTVEPGVTVVFDTGASLVLNGPLFAAGTSEEPITFTTDECAERKDGRGQFTTVRMGFQPARARYRASREAAAIGALRCLCYAEGARPPEAFRADCFRPTVSRAVCVKLSDVTSVLPSRA